MAWDRVDGKAARNPSLSYSLSYSAWRIALLNGHLAYTIVGDTELPPVDTPWDVYKKAVSPAPQIVVHKSDPRPNVVFVLGGPGAGKGTMCSVANIQLGWTHLSAGDLLRAEKAKPDSVNGQLITTFITEGKIVPVEITVNLIKQAMAEVTAATGNKNFLIDGFPRNLNNLEGWNQVMGDDVNVAFMLFFECPLPVLEQRILGRAKYSGRSDDNLVAVRKRFNTYKQETLPIVESFKESKRCIELDSSKPRTEVYAAVKAALAPLTTPGLADQPLTEKSECFLGLRKWK
jgi:UMP-CMP kinase family protein